MNEQIRRSQTETAFVGRKGRSLAESYVSTRINIRAMSPVLLDSRDLFRVGLVSIMFASMVFAGGFMLGFQKAEAVLIAGSTTRVLDLPEVLETTLSEIEPQIPEVVAVGADIDVDEPDSTRVAVTLAAKVEASPVKPARVSESRPVQGRPVATAHAITDAMPRGPANDSAVTTDAVTLTGQDEGAAVENISATIPLPELPSANVLANAKYSIQVGMYGSLQNAENMVQLLRALNMHGYVSEYYNSKNELRYNVRFGFFDSKHGALAALQLYKDKQKGDGYLVRFSAESLSRFTAARERAESVTEQPAASAEQADSTS